MPKGIIAVVGGTGLQGGGVVQDLLARGQFDVRALTRNPKSEKAASLAAKGCEVVEADLSRPETLARAFEGAHGAFVVTNFWDPATGSEHEQGATAVREAKDAGVQHFVWSTLPNCKEISSGRYEVHHFTGKALVDADVAAAGFPHHTFVEAPMYFQNLATNMMPQPQDDGSTAWNFPMDPSNKCIHVGDVTELGRLVARAFEEPGKVGQGQHLSQSAGLMSWEEMVAALNGQGHKIRFHRVPDGVFDALPFPGAAELREMMNYFEEYTYFGPDADRKIAAANELCPEGFTRFEEWTAGNLKP